jgi:hypothetical protein
MVTFCEGATWSCPCPVACESRLRRDTYRSISPQPLNGLSYDAASINKVSIWATMRDEMRGIRIFIVFLLISCANATNMQRIPIGVWGGEHINIDVAEKSASIEYDCAHGLIQGPLVVDANGRFNLRGTHTPERGGPIRADEQPQSQPADYVGSISGNKMTLTLKLKGAEDEVFTLYKDKQGELFKCR